MGCRLSRGSPASNDFGRSCRADACSGINDQMGRRAAVTETKLADATGRLIASATSSLLVMAAKAA